MKINEYNNNLKWRYATKKFDSERQISSEDLEEVLEAIRLSASSYGLQPYHVFVITDKDLRKQLKPSSWGQSQITDASHLIVFANQVDFNSKLIDGYLHNVSETRNIPEKGLEGYGDFMKSKLLDLPKDSKAQWTAKQVYLAVGNLLSAAASLKIDSCPLEGFEPEAYNKILNLDKKGLNASVVVALGYRAKEDETQHYKKVRAPKEELFTHI